MIFVVKVVCGSLV
ncbi:hypothetical protein M2G61_21165 [Vibrio vulnificus]|nr:hypothetical protein [Vibrio vulnificus]